MKGLAILTMVFVLLLAWYLNENPTRISADNPLAPFVAMAIIVGSSVIVLGSLLSIGNSINGIRKVEYHDNSRIWSLTILPAMLVIALCIALALVTQ